MTTWTVFGYWDGEDPVAELAVPYDVEDNRPDDLTGERQPWATAVQAGDADIAKAAAEAEMAAS